jgi:hypothetical protein
MTVGVIADYDFPVFYPVGRPDFVEWSAKYSAVARLPTRTKNLAFSAKIEI